MIDPVVPLGPDDAGELLVLQRAAYVSEARLYGDPRLPPLVQSLDDLRDELGRATALGVRVGGRLVGAVRAEQRGVEWHVGRLIVAPDRQRQGLGSRLLAAVEGARPPGVTTAALFTGHRSEGNLRLYARCGYVERRRERVAQGLVLVHLAKPLGSAAPPTGAATPTPGPADGLRALEESLWRSGTRFDAAHLDAVLAPDFTEVGRSGRVWSRAEVLAMPAVALSVDLPLPGWAVRLLGPGVALATYRSVVRVDGGGPQVAHRSSLWVLDGDRWRLRHHQGTPAA